MKTYFFKLRNLSVLAILISFFSCDGRRDFPDLLETGVNLDKYDIILLVSGQTQEVRATFVPDINPNKEYNWEVENPSVATLVVNPDQSVLLTATGSGETILRITSKDNNSVTATAPLKVISAAPLDITSQAAITVNKENGSGPTGNEGSPKLVDGDVNTKYLAGYSTPFWINLEFPQPVVAGYYALTSGNDAPDRDPKNWEIQGSLDGESWVTLDTRTDYRFTDRKQTREFYFSNNTAYTHYRFDVKSNNGGGLFQMQEWRLFNLPN